MAKVTRQVFDANGVKQDMLYDDEDALGDKAYDKSEALGEPADAAITTNTTGSISGKLRGLIAILADVWSDAANALGVILRRADGTEIGTAAAPIRIDPTGATTQPVSDGGGSLTIDGAVTATLTGTGLADLNTAVGDPASPAVTTDTNGPLISFARGLVTLFVNFLSRIPAALTAAGYLKTAASESGSLTVSAATGVVAAIGTTDCTGYTWFALNLRTMGTNAVLVAQHSPDGGTTWNSLVLFNIAGLSSAGATSLGASSAGASFHGPLPPTGQIRFSVTGITAGTTALDMVLSVLPRALSSLAVSTLAIANTALTNPSDNKSSSTALPVLLQLHNGANTDMQRGITATVTAQSTATLTTNELVVWTPAAGKKFRLRAIWARASNAGRYEVRDAATVVFYVYLAANDWTELIKLEANGRLSAAANNTLRLYNNSGGNADMDVVAAGNEE